MIAAILALVTAQYIGAPIVTDGLLDDWLAPEDAGDYALAIERFQSACLSQAEPGSTGCTLKLTCGRAYDLFSTADVCTSIRIQGCGTGRGLAGNKFVTRTATTAFRTWGRLENCPLGFGWIAGALPTFEHVAIVHYNPQPTTAPIFGLQLGTSTYLNDVEVRGYTQGIRGSCSVGRDPPNNCNILDWRGVTVRLNDHAGIYLQGGDSNAGTMLAVNAMSNCRKAGAWNEILRSPICNAARPPESCNVACANIVDHSFLGNTWVGAHTASAYDAQERTRYSGVLAGGFSQRSTFVGLYSESDQTPSHLCRNCNSIGGIHVFEPSGGMDIRGPLVNRARFRNEHAGVSVDLTLGREINDHGTYLSLVDPIGNRHLRWSFDFDRALWYWDVANNNARPLRIDRECIDGRCGHLYLPDYEGATCAPE